ncbi:TetR/AcrR family transcriptional regulator [Streptomyces varsoviensis]|uniref:TetR family transcriptional regulator n=1 Tax=Streptomyces varsoviensis TaxID=67373 RepID=A0ABR5JEL7_9ACTN|nr:TetR/AcrR family transcriptional regulator [Streptomyces varsoviensis]KOG91860.1 TetR family transcriptional regulator [Streptomyces varsoviensis]
MPLSGDGATEQERAVRRGRPAGDRAAKRAELLKAAASVIAREGYANASLRKVAQRAGCTTGAVTYYFANKQELVTALAESRFDAYEAMLTAGHDRTDVRGLLERWLKLVTGDADFWPVMSQLLAHARYEPGFAALIERRYARYREAQAELLAAGQAQGTVRSDIPADLLADQLSAMGDGWMMMHPFEPERFTPERVRALIDAAATLIAPGSGAGESGAGAGAGDGAPPEVC